MNINEVQEINSAIGWNHSHNTAGKRKFVHSHTVFEVSDQKFKKHIHSYIKGDTQYDTTPAKFKNKGER